MANKNFTQNDAKKAYNMLKNEGLVDFIESKENVSSVTVTRKLLGTKHVFKTNTWDCESMEELGTLLFMYRNNENEVTWDNIIKYDYGMALCEGLGTDTTRKYVKDSYRVSKNFIDMVSKYPEMVICHKDFIKNLTSFKPEKCQAILYKDFYITPKLYEMIKDMAWV